MPDPATVKTVTETISFASGLTDRSLFIALLVIFGAAFWLMTRWFIGRDAAMQARIDVLQLRLDAQGKEFNDFLQNRYGVMGGALQANNDLLASTVECLNKIAVLLSK